MSTAKSAMTDEEFVRGVWEKVDGNAAPDFIFIRIGRKWFQQNSWHAAAEFTRHRLEEVRQIKRELGVAHMWSHTYTMRVTDSYLPNGYNIIGPMRDFIASTRIIARLESELARLTAGMKDGAA